MSEGSASQDKKECARNAPEKRVSGGRSPQCAPGQGQTHLSGLRWAYAQNRTIEISCLTIVGGTACLERYKETMAASNSRCGWPGAVPVRERPNRQVARRLPPASGGTLLWAVETRTTMCPRWNGRGKTHLEVMSSIYDLADTLRG